MKIGVGIGLSYPKYTTFVNRGGGQTSPFHPSLVDYWNFKGKSNADEDRNVIKGVKRNILTAYNFGWALGSGYGLYKENYNNVRQLSGTTGVFSNTDHSIHITNVKTIAIPVTEIPYKAGEVSPEYQIKVTGLLEGQQCSIGYFYNYAGDAKPPVQENLIDIPKDGIYTVPSFTFPSDIKSGTATRIVFNFAGDTDITIEQIPEYEGAIVTDGVDDYLKLDKVGYKIGTVIIKYVPISIHEGWNVVFDTYNDVYENKCLMFYNRTVSNWGSTMNRKIINDYSSFVSNTPKNVDVPLYLAARYENTVKDYLNMALYDIAIYQDVLTNEEIQKEINVMEYGTPNPVFALNFDNFAYKAVDYPDFATGKVTTNKIVVDSTTETFTGAIALAKDPEATTGDPIEVYAYKLKVTGIDAYNNPDGIWGIALMPAKINDENTGNWDSPIPIYKDGVYDIPAILKEDRVYNMGIVSQTVINKPIEIEVLYDKNITKSFPETKQILP